MGGFTIKKSLGSSIAALSLALMMGQTAAAEELTVYTAIEAEDLGKYAERFNEAHPDIEVKWVRDSTGIITAKLLAEKDNPQADVIWGLAATSLLLMKGEGMLMPYAPRGLDQLDAKFRDRRADDRIIRGKVEYLSSRPPLQFDVGPAQP